MYDMLSSNKSIIKTDHAIRVCSRCHRILGIIWDQEEGSYEPLVLHGQGGLIYSSHMSMSHQMELNFVDFGSQNHVTEFAVKELE